MSGPGDRVRAGSPVAADLAVDVDLRIDVDGPAGRTTATVRGHGDRVVVEVADIRTALAALPRTVVSGTGLARAGRSLSAARRASASTGVTVDLRGRRGTWASVGPGGIRPGPAASTPLALLGLAGSVVLSAVVALVAARAARRAQRRRQVADAR